MNYNTLPVDNYQLVTVPFTAAANRYYFPDLPNLRDVYTIGISCYTPQIIATDNNLFNLSTNYNRAFLTLVSGNEEFIQKMDVINFNGISVDGGFGANYGLFQIASRKIHFAKSYVEYAYGTTPAAYPSCLCFGIYYSKTNVIKPKMG